MPEPNAIPPQAPDEAMSRPARRTTVPPAPKGRRRAATKGNA
jgi:hypothetical protein